MQNGWKGAVKLRVNADAMTLYAVTDRTWVKDTTLMDQVKEALEGGITFLQLREKHLSKEEFIKEAREMALAGYPIEQIASQMHRAHKTIQNYLNPDFSVTNGHYNVRIPGKLAPYENEVIKLRSQGLTYPQIHDIICKKGYTGSVASLRMFMQKERTRMHEQNETEKPHSEYVQRKSLCQLVYKKLEDIGTITVKQYQEVLKNILY